MLILSYERMLAQGGSQTVLPPLTATKSILSMVHQCWPLLWLQIFDSASSQLGRSQNRVDTKHQCFKPQTANQLGTVGPGVTCCSTRCRCWIAWDENRKNPPTIAVSSAGTFSWTSQYIPCVQNLGGCSWLRANEAPRFPFDHPRLVLPQPSTPTKDPLTAVADESWGLSRKQTCQLEHPSTGSNQNHQGVCSTNVATVARWERLVRCIYEPLTLERYH